ncbi:MAG: hypothetical protein K9M80_09715 [Candidatus Marinimicrobia bacterium]|nr:hypothetical protein [Candidatus Neomarinimicrobiota bacterium]
MSKNLKRCRDLIAIELEDLKMDIEHLLEINKKKIDNDEITNYVFRENRVTLKDEINAIKTFHRTVDNLSLSNFNSREEIFEYLENKFERIVEEAGYGKGILYFVKRKLNKIRKYLCITQ